MDLICNDTPDDDASKKSDESDEFQNSADHNLRHNSYQSSLDGIHELRIKYPSNPLIGYLNINSLRNKIVDAREILTKFSPDYFVLAETKLDESFPTGQFYINNYEIRTRKDRDRNGGGLIEYVRKGVVCKQLNNFGINNNEIISSELTIRNKKWIIFSVYRPPHYSNLKNFFEELETALNKALSIVDNVIVMGDFNIDCHNPNDSAFEFLNNFCEIFSLENLVKSKTCFAGANGTSIDVILTNKKRCFQNTLSCETGLSDHHQMATTFLKSHLARLAPKKILYRTYKNFNEANFLMDVENANFSCCTDDPEKNYENLVNVFSSIIEKHAPLKQQILRGNEAPFMTKELRKEIYTRSRFKNKYNKNPTDENKARFKKQRNKCVNLRKKAIKKHFKKVTESGIISNKNFWETVKPFISNKSGISNGDIVIVENDNLITDENELTKMFNDYYINILENSSGIKPNSIKYKEVKEKSKIITEIVGSFENHSSIIKIKENKNNENANLFQFQKIDENTISKLFNDLKTKVSTGEDKIQLN